MSTDDYYNDEEDEDLAALEDAGDDEAGEVGVARPAGKGGLGEWLSNRRGWVLVFSLALAQGMFALIMLLMRTGSESESHTALGVIQDLAVEMLGHEVEIKEIYQYMPVRGGKRISVGMELVLVLGQLPDERVEGADKPTPAEFDAFVAAVQDMEPRIRSRMNRLLLEIPAEHYGSTELVEDYNRIKSEIRDYVNDSLERLDFGKQVRRGIGKRRVTEVLIPMFLRQIA